MAARKKWWHTKGKMDPMKRLRRNIGVRLREALRSRGADKNGSVIDHLGCSANQLKIHLESLFKEGMNWDNYGRLSADKEKLWNVDHIIPLASAKSIKEMHALSHYKNLQPMWWRDNIIKGDKILPEFAHLVPVAV